MSSSNPEASIYLKTGFPSTSNQQHTPSSPTSTEDSRDEELLILEVLLRTLGGEQLTRCSSQQIHQSARHFTDLVRGAIAECPDRHSPALGKFINDAQKYQLSSVLAPLGLALGTDEHLRTERESNSYGSFVEAEAAQDDAINEELSEDDEW